MQTSGCTRRHFSGFLFGHEFDSRHLHHKNINQQWLMFFILCGIVAVKVISIIRGVIVKEYKIMRVKMSKDFSEEESLMNTMASEGWEVVSVSPDAHTKLTIHLLTFSREK